MDSNRTHQLLVFADVNVLGKNINTIEKNTLILSGASNKVGLEINIEKTV